MSTNKKPARPSSHAFAYSVAGMLLVCLICIAVLAFLVQQEVTDPAGDSWLYTLAVVCLPLHYGLKWRLRHPVHGVVLSERWTERLSVVVPVGLGISIVTVESGLSAWAFACQLVGGWVIFAVVPIIAEAGLDRVASRVRHWRKR